MSRYPNSVDRFVRKRNKRDSPQTIHDEAISISNGVGEAVLKHDNVNHNSIEIWTGEGKTGTEITSYLLETPSHMEWKTILRVFTNEPQVYVSYEFDGDQVEAEDVNELQSAIEATQTELDRHKENDPHADMRQSEYDTNYDGKVDRADRADVADSVEWGNVDGKPNEFPPGYHLHTEAEISDLDKYSRDEIDSKLSKKADADDFTAHESDRSNPHGVTKAQVGLGNVDNVKQATKTEFDGLSIDFNDHISDNTRHISESERDTWNAKQDAIPYTPEDSANKGQPGGYASLNSKGQIVNSEIPANLKEIRVVADIAERDGLTEVYSGMRVHVRNATDDDSVDEGWAEYLWTGTEWTKTAENESIDVILDWYDIENKPAVFPPESHTHTEDDITDLDKYSKSEVDARLANKSDKGHVHTESDISDLDKYSKAEIDSMLQEKGAGDMLKSVYDKNDNGVVDEAESVPWTGVSGKPSEYPPEQHGHEISEISGLQNELDGKMRAGPVTWNDLKGGGD